MIMAFFWANKSILFWPQTLNINPVMFNIQFAIPAYKMPKVKE